MEFQRHDKVVCRILNYIPKERSFEVEDVISHTKGWVIFVNHYQDSPPMKEAYNNNKTLPLYFDRYEDGTPLFAYKLYNDAPKKESKNAVADNGGSLSLLGTKMLSAPMAKRLNDGNSMSKLIGELNKIGAGYYFFSANGSNYKFNCYVKSKPTIDLTVYFELEN